MHHSITPDLTSFRPSPTLEDLWQLAGFNPNPAQEAAIRHIDGPLYLPAGPGSGKTRVLLWRTLNLIVYHGVRPADIFLSTFTEKAAHQLREGLQGYLAMVSNKTGQAYDLSPMYIGTVHSLCGRMLTDRRFSQGRQRTRPPRLMDDLDQYFYLYRSTRWNRFLENIGLDPETASSQLKELFRSFSSSRHHGANNSRNFFNRLSEECIDSQAAIDKLESEILASYLAEHGVSSDALMTVLRLYEHYRNSLSENQDDPITDFALVQQEAYDTLVASNTSGNEFKYVIVDEYQDTNTIQERIFFKLMEGQGNICVVGDDDQALYRFRGATVENFVRFPQRCHQYLGRTPFEIPLVVNYRSRSSIVDLYTRFMNNCDWVNSENGGHYRVLTKRILPHRLDNHPAVVATAPAKPVDAFAEIAHLVRRLIDEGKVADPNQIAFLFPSLQYRGEMNGQVKRMKDALEALDLQVYAPRAGRFLDGDEAVAMFGLFAQVLGAPGRGEFSGGDFGKFHDWLEQSTRVGQELMFSDERLARFIQDKRAEIALVTADYQALLNTLTVAGWEADTAYDPHTMQSTLLATSNLTAKARRSLAGAGFNRIAESRILDGTPFTLGYVLSRATSLDWSLLDLFYRFTGFRHFRAMMDLAESGKDEGPICNLGLITEYLSRFMDQYFSIISAERLVDGYLQRLFFSQYLFALFRLGESEFESKDDIFPRGRIPILTIHQAKGLEFPVVVLPNPRRDNKQPNINEILVRPFLERTDNEPLDRSALFDGMRMFYVALSRAENLLVLGNLKGPGQSIYEPLRPFFKEIPRIADLDLATVPAAAIDHNDMPRSYSYTADFLTYRKCPRNYMVFRRYGLSPSRSQTMFFGTLVHQTLEDLHNTLIDRKSRNDPAGETSIEDFLAEAFEKNYESLRAAEGRAVSPDVQQTAYQQVRLYWRKMRAIAESITDTEVRLCLPNQKTPNDHTYSIEGVVDIVRDNDRTIMYDIKTHDGDYVRAHREVYEDQLNVYAHIWKELRGRPLDECAVIATDYPDTIRRALAREDEHMLEEALQEWDPLVPINHNVAQVQETIKDFGQVVDQINRRAFQPVPPSRLTEIIAGKDTFGTRVCRNCDARFSCSSYEVFAKRSDGAHGEQYFNFYFDDEIQEGWIAAGLNAQPRVEPPEPRFLI